VGRCEANKARQETFNLRMEFNDQNHEEKIRIDQELFMLKNKIGQLEHEIEDKESEIRRVQIELDITRNAPPTAPLISEEEVQELRMEISKKQRDLINMRFELEERDYQIGSLTNNINMAKLNLKEYQ
jgi:chromosome segregation ATPase